MMATGGKSSWRGNASQRLQCGLAHWARAARVPRVVQSTWYGGYIRYVADSAGNGLVLEAEVCGTERHEILVSISSKWLTA